MIKSDTEKVSEQLREQIETTEVDLLERGFYRLSDAIREGASVTEKATGTWGEGENACALHASVIAAHARGYIA
jgi:hypothetical protein